MSTDQGYSGVRCVRCKHPLPEFALIVLINGNPHCRDTKGCAERIAENARRQRDGLEANVPGGILDKILKTPTGRTLEITPDEDYEIKTTLFKYMPYTRYYFASDEYPLLGRTVRVKYP